MKNNEVIFSLVLFHLLIFGGAYATVDEPADHVDPFIGTGIFEGHAVWGRYPGTYPGGNPRNQIGVNSEILCQS